MSKPIRVGWMTAWSLAAFLVTAVVPFAQGPTDNPYRPVRGLADVCFCALAACQPATR